MENETKVVKVYSNNSKKSRLKRNKNKFQRVWDAEKQTYIKVRKAKYPVRPQTSKKDWREIDDSKALKRRHTTPKKQKSVPVKTVRIQSKPETKSVVKHNVDAIPVATSTKAVSVKLYGQNLKWDNNSLRYKAAA